MLDKDKLNQLYRYALSLTHDEGRAYDLVHESIVKAQGRFIINQQAYLKRCIRNLFYDFHKKEKREEPISNDFENEVNFEDIIIAKDEVGNLCGELLPEERELLFLSLVEGYSYREISRLTESKIGTVMSKLHRCKEKIKKMRRGYEE